jgi:hypothetical protein
MLSMFSYIFFMFAFIVESVKFIVGTMSSFCISPSIVGGVMVYVFVSSAVERLSVHVYVFASSAVERVYVHVYVFASSAVARLPVHVYVFASSAE